MSDNSIQNKIKDIINLPRMQSTFTGANLLGIFSNVFLFVFVQTAFFYFVASKQFNNVLASKVDIVNTYLQHDNKAKEEMKVFLNSDEVKEVQRLAKEQEEKRNEANIELIKKDILPLLIVVGGLVALVIYAMYTNKANQWSGFDKTDQVLLWSVLLAYSTELLFFFGIVRQYEFYGDHAIINKFYENIQNRFDGKGYLDIDRTVKQVSDNYQKVSELNKEYQITERVEQAQQAYDFSREFDSMIGEDREMEEGWTAN